MEDLGEKAYEYFNNYDDILQTVVMRDKVSGCPRGLGFVVLVNLVDLDMVLQCKNPIDGRTVRFKFLVFFLFFRW